MTAKAFIEGDVYIDYPYEDVKFRWHNETRKVYRRFYGRPESEIPHSSELFHEAQSGGWRIAAEDYYQDQDAARHEESGGLAQALAVASTPTCGVCGQVPATVCDSALGQKPYARCATCLEMGAESIAAICLEIFRAGGPEMAEKNDPDNWWPYGVKSYDDGRYVGWLEIRGIYPRYARHFRKNW